MYCNNVIPFIMCNNNIYLGAGRGKWREMSGIVCDKWMPIVLKVAIYKTITRLVLMYLRLAMKKVEQDLLEIHSFLV